jgi:hypothetical protein
LLPERSTSNLDRSIVDCISLSGKVLKKERVERERENKKTYCLFPLFFIWKELKKEEYKGGE